MTNRMFKFYGRIKPGWIHDIPSESKAILDVQTSESNGYVQQLVLILKAALEELRSGVNQKDLEPLNTTGKKMGEQLNETETYASSLMSTDLKTDLSTSSASDQMKERGLYNYGKCQESRFRSS
uniref:Uncharacterized protein n=1 Tax=Iconisemion striatum TaxID=60296 RepID=A0A1A7YHB9_9TELE